MDWIGRLQMIALHVVGIGWCLFLYWIGGVWVLDLWLILGMLSLIFYIKTWTDVPALWWWPYLIMCWPIIWIGGIVHPLR